MSEWAIVVAIISATIGLLNFLHNRFVVEAGVARQLGEIVTKLKALEDVDEVTEKQITAVEKEIVRRLIAIETDIHDVPILKAKMEIFWRAVEDHVPNMLFHPDDLDRDKLVAKAKARILTPEEARELKAILDVDLAHPDKLSSEQVWASFLYSIECEYIMKGLSGR